MQTYELQGGKANILVCEDGMQLLSLAEQAERRVFYETHGCGWVARPGHKQNGFIRAGRFKKASNLNFATDFAYRVQELVESGFAYEEALQGAITESKGTAWAEGDVRIGKYLFLIDVSDNPALESSENLWD